MLSHDYRFFSKLGCAEVAKTLSLAEARWFLRQRPSRCSNTGLLPYKAYSPLLSSCKDAVKFQAQCQVFHQIRLNDMSRDHLSKSKQQMTSANRLQFWTDTNCVSRLAPRPNPRGRHSRRPRRCGGSDLPENVHVDSGFDVAVLLDQRDFAAQQVAEIFAVNEARLAGLRNHHEIHCAGFP